MAYARLHTDPVQVVANRFMSRDFSKEELTDFVNKCLETELGRQLIQNVCDEISKERQKLFKNDNEVISLLKCSKEQARHIVNAAITFKDNTGEFPSLTVFKATFEQHLILDYYAANRDLPFWSEELEYSFEKANLNDAQYQTLHFILLTSFLLAKRNEFISERLDHVKWLQTQHEILNAVRKSFCTIV